MIEQDVLDRIREVAGGADELVALYLFGSHADGSATTASDVDLAALGRRPLPLDDVIDLQQRFAEAIGRPVDLIDLRRAEAFLALAVIRGERLLCRDSLLADEYELFVMRRAGDLAPFERERREAALARPLTPPTHRRPR